MKIKFEALQKTIVPLFSLSPFEPTSVNVDLFQFNNSVSVAEFMNG